MPYEWTEPVDPWQEHCDYEANARYDYVSEAYGDMKEDNLYEAYYDALDQGFEGSFSEWKVFQTSSRNSRPFVPVDTSDDIPF